MEEVYGVVGIDGVGTLGLEAEDDEGLLFFAFVFILLEVELLALVGFAL